MDRLRRSLRGGCVRWTRPSVKKLRPADLDHHQMGQNSSKRSKNAGIAIEDANDLRRPQDDERHSCQGEYSRKKGAVVEECLVCFDTRGVADGLYCSADHFVCDWCMESYVSSQLQDSFSLSSMKGGGLPCPMKPCNNIFSPYAISNHISSDMYDRYFRAYTFAIESAVEARMNFAFEAKVHVLRKEMLERALEDLHDVEVHKHVLYIADEILTLKCPNSECRQAFVDFTGCFAIECHRCRSFFCGWCLEKCGSSADVHSHITICSKKLNTRDYHGTFLEFKKAHAGRRQAELVKYLNKNVRDKKVKEKVRKRVEFALSDY